MSTDDCRGTMALNSPTGVSDDQYDTVLAFLEEAFAGRPMGVTEEVKARAGMLPGQRPGLTAKQEKF